MLPELVLPVHVTLFPFVTSSSPCPPAPVKLTGKDVASTTGSLAEAMPAPITAMTERAARTANPNDLRYFMLLSDSSLPNIDPNAGKATNPRNPESKPSYQNNHSV